MELNDETIMERTGKMTERIKCNECEATVQLTDSDELHVTGNDDTVLREVECDKCGYNNHLCYSLLEY